MNACSSAFVSWRRAAEQVHERGVELLERRLLVERVAARVVAGGAIAAPVHRPLAGQTAQALRRHRPLQRMERTPGRPSHEGVRVALRRAERIAEIPRQAVEIAEDVAARARAVAVARGSLRVVQEAAAARHVRRLGVVAEIHLLPQRARARVGRVLDDRDLLVESVHHVEAVVRRIEHEAAGPGADVHDRVVGDARVGVLEIGGVEHGDVARAEGGDEQRGAVGREDHAEREGDTLVDLGLRPGGDVVVGVRVQVVRRRRGAVDHRDAVLGRVAAHAVEASGRVLEQRLEALGVARF